MSEQLHFIKRRGGIILLYGDHQYYKVKSFANESQLWRCSLYKKNKCSGNIILKDNRIKSMNKQHCCQPVLNKNDIDKEFAKLKEEVVTSDLPIPNLYAKTVTTLKNKGLHLISEIPTLENVKHGMYNARNNAVAVTKTVFKNFKDVEVPNKFESFLFADYDDGESRILIFISEEAINQIASIKEFFGDGTFKSCPYPFYQLYIIFGDLGSSTMFTNALPLIFALLPDKKERTYATMFDILKTKLCDFKPKQFHVDFELGAMNALIEFFPDIEIVVCYYHWTNAIWKKAKKLRLVNSKPKKRIVALTSVLPLLPEECIQDGWKYIKSECEEYQVSMTTFIQYVEKFWFKVSINNSNKKLSVFGQRHRTNNVAEGFNGKLNKALNKNTVTLLRLLNYIKNNLSTIHKEKTIVKRKKQLIENDDYILAVQMQIINNEITIENALDKLR